MYRESGQMSLGAENFSSSKKEGQEVEDGFEEESRVDLLPEVNKDALVQRTVESTRPQDQKRVERSLNGAVDVYKYEPLTEAAGERLQHPGNNDAEGQAHGKLWEMRTARLKPEFQRLFGDEFTGAQSAKNVMSASREQVGDYRIFHIKRRQEIGKMIKDLRATPGEASKRSIEQHEKEISNLDASDRALDNLERIPGYFDLTEQYKRETDPKKQREIGIKIEALLTK
ncbi:hypothetical protein A2316_03890 [Candidatus Falkowbacteria bacterium RIFOXYB2_FULL_38_15]|uniref:Uncharacterized protein n=1 Tax=Candidatus Falkowbacteria bacterium RIFOXYA2_FULL_38_12 TaxID=1797993 RepID=A0A1F5S1T5_9BACT|nr:MAG: hypothetical protein A2257_01345 [Candidatus Falkowbacteria bacterium RIFOXYA2_FULL_38_12]OGF33199.1 MAG: hypothetical protein A2316_03890 [Candidatus Falkowbacteria bacterium RIFOXYB2_FULL_38_15]OGF42120.1 MAG: hypothetical protein A2555_03390 [Candidatus Falkowbacteria bacterium RIFOXYD2_FULL_39_16]